MQNASSFIPLKIKYIPFLISKRHAVPFCVIGNSKGLSYDTKKHFWFFIRIKNQKCFVHSLYLLSTIYLRSLFDDLLLSASFLSAVLHSTSRARFIQANLLRPSYHHWQILSIRVHIRYIRYTTNAWMIICHQSFLYSVISFP